MTKSGVADMLTRFVGDEPGCGDWEWDDFVSTRAEPELEPFRLRLAAIDPSSGVPAIRQIIRELRSDA
jgi:hypothetical protein